MPEYKLSDLDKAKCFEHLLNGYGPQITYKTLYGHGELPPCTFPVFLREYIEFIVQVTRPTGDRWAVAPDAAQLANLRRIERCAEIALNGMDLGLFYIPTHAHIAQDIEPRYRGVLDALSALGLR